MFYYSFKHWNLFIKLSVFSYLKKKFSTQIIPKKKVSTQIIPKKNSFTEMAISVTKNKEILGENTCGINKYFKHKPLISFRNSCLLIILCNI